MAKITPETIIPIPFISIEMKTPIKYHPKNILSVHSHLPDTGPEECINLAPTAEQIIEAQSKVVWEAAFAGTLTEEVLRKNESADLDWVNPVGGDMDGGWRPCHAAVNGESPFKMLRLLIIHGADPAEGSEGDVDYGMTTEEMARENHDDACMALCQWHWASIPYIESLEKGTGVHPVPDGNGSGEEAWALRVIIPHWVREQDSDYEDDLKAGKYYEDEDEGLHLTHKVLKKDIQPTHPYETKTYEPLENDETIIEVDINFNREGEYYAYDSD